MLHTNNKMLSTFKIKPMLPKAIWVLLLIAIPSHSIAQGRTISRIGKVSTIIQKHKHGEVKAENKKIIAITLGVALGIFGVHRLYLGTEEHIPLIYGVTLGGGGIITIIDIVAIAATKDLEKYQNNGKVFMWSGNNEDATP